MFRTIRSLFAPFGRPEAVLFGRDLSEDNAGHARLEQTVGYDRFHKDQTRPERYAFRVDIGII